MKKYAVIQTWDGEGMKTENKIVLTIEFNHPTPTSLVLSQVHNYWNHLLKTGQFNHFDVIETENGIEYNDSFFNRGTLKFYDITEAFGTVIYCDTGEVLIVQEPVFKQMYEESLQRSEDSNRGEEFIEADVNFKFIKF